VWAGLRSVWIKPRPSGTTIAAARVPYGPARTVTWLGQLEHAALDEASGLALSRNEPKLLWALNDSGNANELFALSPSGRDLGRVPVIAPALGDWEDLAAFELEGKHYLIIGDVGDNFAWRRTLDLHVVLEPKPPGAGRVGPPITIAWTIRYRYPQGYRDCEALAVDESSQSVILISKRAVPAEVFRLPLHPSARKRAQTLTATRIALLKTIPQPDASDYALDPKKWEGNAMPTALDIAGDTAAVVTYRDAYIYRRGAGETWASAFGRIPERVALPGVRGREAAALSTDASALYITGERDETRPALIFRVDLR
jgi:hypothetical protein